MITLNPKTDYTYKLTSTLGEVEHTPILVLHYLDFKLCHNMFFSSGSLNGVDNGVGEKDSPFPPRSLLYLHSMT